MSLDVADEYDGGVWRKAVLETARQTGFKDSSAEKIVFLVNEMALMTIHKGKKEGQIFLCRIKDERARKGMEIWNVGSGIGETEVEAALHNKGIQNHYLEAFIGTMTRLSDEFELHTGCPPELEAERGARFDLNKGEASICLRFWLPPEERKGCNRDLEIGAASRPLPGENKNGDAFFISHLSSARVLAAVIDGLGHGREAHEVSQAGLKCLEDNPDLPLDLLMVRLHKIMQGTRGATVGLSHIDTEKDRISFLGIGNISARHIRSDEKHALISLGGIVGHKMRTLRVFEHEFIRGDVLALYSDGISSDWQYNSSLWTKHAQLAAEEILHRFARDRDDATTLIIKYS